MRLSSISSSNQYPLSWPIGGVGQTRGLIGKISRLALPIFALLSSPPEVHASSFRYDPQGAIEDWIAENLDGVTGVKGLGEMAIQLSSCAGFLIKTSSGSAQTGKAVSGGSDQSQSSSWQVARVASSVASTAGRILAPTVTYGFEFLGCYQCCNALNYTDALPDLSRYVPSAITDHLPHPSDYTPDAIGGFVDFVTPDLSTSLCASICVAVRNIRF